MENPATTNQPREPLASLPIPGMSTRTSSTMVTAKPGNARPRIGPHRHAQRHVEANRPTQRPSTCLAKIAHGEPSSS